MNGKVLEEFRREVVIRESLFFRAKLRGMRFSPAAHEPHRMFLVQHLMVEDIGDYVWGNSDSIELAIDHDLVQRRIEAA